ncbi:23S rRNA (pseudouridine(1915)-N(3))-methyltransferase RlmH [Dethiobacter alkaliphilus]|uniref:23S rRNA (pseudouridine(1915)-N(3))-methyltransferase RlmH n=1 Tax=Dethiobacter alkaliphilus TaxID=427926 RepID=UPI0022280074|nr:23S rRNA (pseudouridine(1915)-N(3))-methyltransferase RlmH [Dethiobacter alkaliphilus]MCW3488936.1 23S rRNA (pseudouridine(1915)-N(3))-methyltransferase RlmH [Dethiobacter alkaliphilus]
MQIQILTVGKIKEKYLKMGIDEYTKRLGPFARVEIREVKDEKTPDGASAAEEEQIQAKETARLKALLKPGTYIIALDIKGKNLSSPEFAARLDNLATTGQSHITFLIGGSLGLSPELLNMADLRLSFSAMTFPHQLFRLILLEQIYRAYKINRGEPYHK